jgi:hypothetical protein
MRNDAWTYGRRLVEWLAISALGHGIILYLATIEIFPDRFVAAMITTAVAAPAWAHWIMAALFGLLGTVLLERFLWTRHGFLGPSRSLDYAVALPDMKVSDAIDYIVNDSVAILRKPQPNEGSYPPGTRIIVKGVEHQDAREQLGAELNNGQIKSWGRRQLNTYLPNQFESSLREIPKEYWDDMELDFQSCLYYKNQLPQTMKIAGRPETYHWVGIMLSRAQVEQYWPKKSAPRRACSTIMRRPRIKHAYGVTVGK